MDKSKISLLNAQLCNIFYLRKLLKGTPHYIYVKNSKSNQTQ